MAESRSITGKRTPTSLNIAVAEASLLNHLSRHNLGYEFRGEGLGLRLKAVSGALPAISIQTRSSYGICKRLFGFS